ncbi:MAG: lipid A deacylase LpxR family protein, partial [Kangiellaceae bacterium]|nr:lipid A deacylase LpxR family protein [Kangiellaceae bacterium]
YGRELTSSFPSTLFSGSRTTNPAAVNEGWNIYVSLEAGYVFNQIFTDGNTYTDSRSIDYDKEFIGISAGFAYAWENWTVTFAMNDANLIQGDDVEEALEDLTQYGSLTVAWRL